MSEKLSRNILIGELVVIVLPLSLLLLIATLNQIYSTISFFFWRDIVITLLAFLAWVALISGFIIAKSFIKQSSVGLHNQKPYLWMLSLIGILIPIAAWISTLLPPSPDYSNGALFRDDLEFFILSFPIFIPLAHLFLERFFRKDKSI